MLHYTRKIKNTSVTFHHNGIAISFFKSVVSERVFVQIFEKDMCLCGTQAGCQITDQSNII
jgi:hypothetical protein